VIQLQKDMGSKNSDTQRAESRSRPSELSGTGLSGSEMAMAAIGIVPSRCMAGLWELFLLSIRGDRKEERERGDPLHPAPTAAFPPNNNNNNNMR